MGEPAEAGTTFDAQVGERVHLLMWRASRTQTEMGRQVGIDQSVLSKKLRGITRWYAGEISAIARTLRTTSAYLMGETDDPTLPRLDSNQQPSD